MIDAATRLDAPQRRRAFVRLIQLLEQQERRLDATLLTLKHLTPYTRNGQEGSLRSHLRSLEAAGLVEVDRAATWRPTPAGRLLAWAQARTDVVISADLSLSELLQRPEFDAVSGPALLEALDHLVEGGFMDAVAGGQGRLGARIPLADVLVPLVF